ncbi:hypothetical protein [Pseudomonas syringae]|uniref:hypothetical protein n=1 Tax=Pseudomonas syringae TaxID=317 RepID=UPI0018E5B5AD|nr:hypothetical protein [Pseudomonas syringae]MBI6794981.1 hypothetical protein [Pseudomonas syringae]
MFFMASSLFHFDMASLSIYTNCSVVPQAAPLAVLQAAINAAADLNPKYTRAFEVVLKKSEASVSDGEVGINRWLGASSSQGFSAAGQRAKRGDSYRF